MTTCAEIISYSATRGRIIRPGATLKASEAADGMLALQGMYSYWATGMFGRLTNVLATANAEAEINTRIRVDGAFTITLPTTVDSTETLPPPDLSMVEIIYTDPAVSREQHVYEAGVADWVRIDGLALTDVAPFATRGATGLADALAMYWNESFGDEPPANVKRGAQAFLRSIMWKFDADEVVAEYY